MTNNLTINLKGNCPHLAKMKVLSYQVIIFGLDRKLFGSNDYITYLKKTILGTLANVINGKSAKNWRKVDQSL